MWRIYLLSAITIITNRPKDVFNVITFHVHCFYAYARRIFVSQSCALMSLWRLFRGKKFNPLRNRVDSSPHENVEQLFVGTLAFTILLFLYPTTLVYYIVFAVLESCLTVTNAAVKWLVESFTSLAEYEDEESNSKDNYFKGCWKKELWAYLYVIEKVPFLENSLKRL